MIDLPQLGGVISRMVVINRRFVLLESATSIEETPSVHRKQKVL